jgi:hypothetical protein
MSKNNARNLTFVFYADPDHAWLGIKRQLLLQYPKAALAISNHSYQRGQTVYLQEDCDADLFLEALRADNERFTVVAKHGNQRSPIRSYDVFALTEVEMTSISRGASA